MEYKVASVGQGVAHLVNLAEFESFKIPINLAPAGIQPGQVVSIKIERSPAAEQAGEEQVLKLQDDISVFLRSRQK